MSKFSILDYYAIIISITGFILYAINTWLYTYTESGQIDIWLTIVCPLGGSLGILIAFLFLCRVFKKENMMSSVYLFCCLIIDVVVFLFLKGVHGDAITFAFGDFFLKYKFLIVYLALINLITFAVFAMDKLKAGKHQDRIRIVVLLGLAFIGGSLGGLVAMYVFRHKTQKDYFTVGVPLIIIA